MRYPIIAAVLLVATPALHAEDGENTAIKVLDKAHEIIKNVSAEAAPTAKEMWSTATYSAVSRTCT